MKKQEIRSVQGITLSALVITIVVLLILAGVAINTIFNQNGIMKKAVESQNKMDTAQDSDLNAINELNNWLIDKSNQNKGTDGVLELPDSMLMNDSAYSYKLTVESAAYNGNIELKMYGYKDGTYIAAAEIKDNKSRSLGIRELSELLDESTTIDGIVIGYEGSKTDEENNGAIVYDTSKLGSELKVKKIEKIKKEYSLMGNLIVKAFETSEITADDMMPFVQYCANRNELGYAYANKLVKENQGKSLSGDIGEVTEDIFSNEVEKQLLTHIVNNEGETIKAVEKALRDQIYNIIFQLRNDKFDTYTMADYIEENKYLNEYEIRLIGNTIIPFTVIFKNVVLEDLNADGKITTANNGNYTIVVDKYTGLEYRAAASAYGTILEYYPEGTEVPESEEVYLKEISDTLNNVILTLSGYWYTIYNTYTNGKMDNIYTVIKDEGQEINIAGLRLGYYTFISPEFEENEKEQGFKINDDYDPRTDTKYLEMQGITDSMIKKIQEQMKEGQ